MAAESGRTIRSALLSAAQSLCNDFSSACSTSTLLSHFSSDSSSSSPSVSSTLPVAYEHGHPSLGPFLGRCFQGRSGIEQYFNLLQQYLTFENMRFSDYAIDEEEKLVFVRGEARFTWKETAKGWDEVFAYRLQYVQEKGEWKVARYEVWADSGSLYLASIGEEPAQYFSVEPEMAALFIGCLDLKTKKGSGYGWFPNLERWKKSYDVSAYPSAYPLSF